MIYICVSSIWVVYDVYIFFTYISRLYIICLETYFVLFNSYVKHCIIYYKMYDSHSIYIFI